MQTMLATLQSFFVPVSGALILFFGLGACLGPILSSALIAWIGPMGFYYFTAICGGTLGTSALLCRRKLATHPDDQVPYVPIPKTSPVVSSFDPRGDADTAPEYKR
jgi:hypothetical protein